jgi:nucleoside-diphosphate-sugar epimerase
LILVTGGSGFLGQFISQYLRRFGRVKTLSRSHGDYICDLSEAIPELNQVFDLVVHSAGMAHKTPRSVGVGDLFHSVNVIGTLRLLEALENAGLPRGFVFISSVAVYGLSNGTLINESSELSAIDPYGHSKIQAEKLVKQWCKEHGVTCTILRLPLIAGPNPPGNLGSMIKGLKRGLYFNISGGKARKSMVLASDVAKFIYMASEVGGVYNLTDGNHPSFFEISENISLQLKKNRPKNLPFWFAKVLALIGDLFVDKAPLNSDRLRKISSDLTFDDSKAREAFGWDPTPVLNGFKISDTD